MPRPKASTSLTVSETLRLTVRDRKVTAAALGREAKVSPSVITRFLNNERGLSSDTLDRLCAALGLELRETRHGLGK